MSDIEHTTNRSYYLEQKVYMTKDDILSSILPLASKEGLRNLSLSRIAENAGIAKSTLYSHFESKDQMINELYLFLREKAKRRRNLTPIDYKEIVKGKTLEEILFYVVDSYDSIIREKDMNDFYRIINSEKSVSKIAAKIITEETETMFRATKNLFYALEGEEIAHFPNLEGAALLFASAIHSILCLILDDETAETKVSFGVLEKTIKEFSRLYSYKEEENEKIKT